MLKEIYNIKDIDNPENVAINIKNFKFEYLDEKTLAVTFDKVIKKRLNNKEIFNFIRYLTLNSNHRKKKSKFKSYIINDEWIILENDSVVFLRINIKKANYLIIINSIYNANEGSFKLISEYHKIFIENNKLKNNNYNIEYKSYSNNILIKEGKFLLDKNFNFIFNENNKNNIEIKSRLLDIKGNINPKNKYFSLNGFYNNRKVNYLKIFKLYNQYITRTLLHCKIDSHLDKSLFCKIENNRAYPVNRNGLPNETNIIRKVNSLLNDYDIDFDNLTDKENSLIQINIEQ